MLKPKYQVVDLFHPIRIYAKIQLRLKSNVFSLGDLGFVITAHSVSLNGPHLLIIEIV